MLFRDFVRELERRGKIVKVDREIDPILQMTGIIKKYGKRPVLFTNVKGSDTKVISNVCSSRDLLCIGLGIKKRDILRKIIHAINNPVPLEEKNREGYVEMKPDLNKLPIPKFFSEDGGNYITSGVAISYDKKFGFNASYHRAMVIGKNRMVMRILPRDFYKYIERGNRIFTFCIGNPVSVMISSAISVEIEKDELEIANSLYPIKILDFDGVKGVESEIVMVCEVTEDRENEGPFVDITQTLDVVRKQPVVEVKKIYLKEDALFHAILPAGYEHKLLMGLPREATIYREVSKVCDVVDVSLTPGGCSWLHGVISIRKKHKDDGKKAIEQAFRGHRSMKHVFIVDDDIDVHNPNDVEWAFATRFQGDRDMVIRKEEGSSLDPSADPITRETTKIGFDLTIPFDKDRKLFKKVEE